MPTIQFQHVSKQYQLGSGRRSLRETLPSLSRRLLGRTAVDAQESNLWALDDVSFSVRPGEILGLVGANGAGKSTILKLLSRVTQPTSGSISVSGRVSALIELGAGFHPDLTGRENVYLSGSILGLTRREIDDRFDSIVDFSELREFLDTPVKRYSSGMYVRLGFAVAVHVEPEVLLIDEVLAVGDIRFRDKCSKHIDELRRRGTTMVIVSHDRHMLERLCDRALLLHRGRLLADGNIGDIMDQYYQLIHKPFDALGQILPSSATADHGHNRPPVEITSVSVSDRVGHGRDTFLSGESMQVRIAFRANSFVENPVFYCDIVRDGALLNGSNSARFNLPTGTFEPGKEGVIEILYESVNLLDGEYSITAGITQDVFTQIKYHAIDNAATFEVNSSIRDGFGLVNMPQRWSIRGSAAEPSSSHNRRAEGVSS